MNKLAILVVAVLLYASNSFSQGVAINTTHAAPDGSAMLDVSSTIGGMLIPRMTKSQRDAIGSPGTGLLIYQTDDIQGFYYYNGTSWRIVGAEAFCIDDLWDGKTISSSVFLGENAGMNEYGSDYRNVALGVEALKEDTTGQRNTAVGFRALWLNSNGNHNTANGYGALLNNSTGSRNTAFGYQSSLRNTTGDHNTVVGQNANFNNEEGSYNTIIGYQAGMGSSPHNKSGNVFLGYQAGYHETGSNKLYIENSSSTDPLLYGEFDNDLLRINGTLDINGSYQLPSSDGSSEQMLKTDGSGILSWADEIDGDVSNEGSLSVGPGTSTTALIQSNTNGSSDITLEAFTGLSITETGNTITLINTVTDTWRGIDNTPVSGATAVSISSDWASYHLNFSNPHGITKTTIGLWNVENIALSSWAGTPNITTLGTITTGTFPWANLSGTPSAFNPESHGNEAHSSTFLTTVAIDDLFDGKSDGFSIYLGIGAGYDDDESDNNNLGVGRNTLYEVLSGEYNIALGSSALGRLTTGNYNVGIGNAALYNNITGSNNTAIGYQAGHLNTDRTGCVLIGYRAGYAEGGDNKLYIENSSSSSPLIYGDFDTDKVTINDILILTPRSSFPSSPVEGEIFVSNTHHIYCYLNSSWVQLDN